MFYEAASEGFGEDDVRGIENKFNIFRPFYIIFMLINYYSILHVSTISGGWGS